MWADQAVRRVSWLEIVVMTEEDGRLPDGSLVGVSSIMTTTRPEIMVASSASP